MSTVSAIRYATRQTRKRDVFYRFDDYGEADAAITMDYFFWIVQRGDETIVVDTGFAREEGRRRGRTCIVEPAAALHLLGIDARSVGTVVVTHVHYDHVGNLDLFANAEVVLARRELDFWTSSLAAREQFAHHVVPSELAFLVALQAAGRLRLLDGDEQLGEGVHAVVVGGHSAAIIVLEVDTPTGTVVLASDSLHFYEELERDRPFSVLVDLPASYLALDRLRSFEAGGASLVAGHDPAVLERFPRLERGGMLLGAAIA